MDIAAWLRGLGLQQYDQVFREHAIDADVLPELTDEHLEKLGVPLGHRLKILRAIAALRAAAREPNQGAGAAGIAASAPEGERRQVTVLYADLVGYTALGRELDAEEVRAILERFFALVDGIVLDHGGTVDKHIGDCVMAVFGAPVAHGNDAERAARAAISIRDAVPGLGAEIGREIGVHVGLASGQVVAGGIGSEAHHTYTVTGDSVNLASRLTDRAAAGEILVSDALQELLPEGFELAAMGPLTVEGFGEPVRAWRLLAIGGGRKATARPFVGRRAELHQFEGVLRACSETGTGQTVHVRGEAGIGKTRLVEEFRALAERGGWASHVGMVLDFGAATGRDAVRSLVRSLLDLDMTNDHEAVETAAKRAVADRAVASEQQAHLNDLLDLPQPEPLRVLYEAMDNDARNRGKRETVARLVRFASAGAPRLLVVEDVHWADPLTLGHLTTLAATVAACPAVLVLTSRVEGDPLDQAWRVATGGATLVTIDLAPLREREAEALAGAYLDTTTAFARRCITRAAGNPLFLDQLLRHAEENAEASVPGSIQSLVQARMDRLAAADKEALQAASIFGQRIPPDALRHLLGRADYECGALIAQFLVSPQGQELVFTHALIRDAVYDTLLKAHRRELHRQAATWYAELDPVLHAEHLDRAVDPAAPSAYLGAAESQSAMFRYERALALAERGLALASLDRERFSLGLLRAELLRDLGHAGHAKDGFRGLLDLAGGEIARCRAWIGVASCVRLLGGYEEGIEALDRAEPLARRHHGERELAQISYYRGCLLFAAGNVEGCLEQHERARQSAVRAGDPEWEAWTLSGLGDAYYGRGQMHLALEQFRRCAELCREHGFGRIEVGSRHMRGVTRRYLNEFVEAIEDLRIAASTAAQVGNARTEMAALTILGELLVDHGDLEDAYAAFDRARAICDTFHNRRYGAYILYELGRALWHDAARRSEAEGVLDEALSLARDTDLGFIGARVLAAKALATTDGATRRAALREGEAILGSGCLSHLVLWFHRDAIEASLRAGEWADAERHAAALEEHTRPEPLPWADFFIARGRALATHGRGRRDRATPEELSRLRDQAERVGLRAALQALDQALAD